MSNNCKVKGILKGLRFISQIFDNDKESEIDIGYPTDVKHVAHIGVDSNHSDNSSASWMNGFESIPGLSSGSLDLNGDNHNKEPHNSGRQVTKDSSRRGSSRHVDYQGHEGDITRSMRQSTGNMRECQAKEKSDKPRQPKKTSKHHSKDSSSHVSKSIGDVGSFQLQGNNNNNNDDDDDLPPKKSRSKLTTKDGSIGGGSDLSKSRSRAQTKDRNHGSTHSHSRSKQRSFEEDTQIERGSNENILRN